MLLLRSFVVAAALAVTGPALVACDAVLGPSKAANGERYETGDARYDPFFEAVHEQHVAAGSWRDEKANARKTIVILAGVTSSASDEVLVRSMRERAKSLGPPGAHLDVASAKVVLAQGATDDPQLVAAITEAARRELDRARKMAAAIEKLEQLKKQGEELEREAADEVANAVDKVDEKKQGRRREIKRELSGAVSSLGALAKTARRHVKDAEELLDGLDAALQHKERVVHEGRPFPPPGPPGESDAKATTKGAAKPEPSAKPAKPPGKPTAPAAPAAPAPPTKPAEAKPAMPKPAAPKPPESGEVFNP